MLCPEIHKSSIKTLKPYLYRAGKPPKAQLLQARSLNPLGHTLTQECLIIPFGSFNHGPSKEMRSPMLYGL